MLKIIVAWVIAMSFVTSAKSAENDTQENEKPIPWNTGRLYVEPSEIDGVENAVVIFEDGTRIILRNLLVDEEKKEVSNYNQTQKGFRKFRKFEIFRPGNGKFQTHYHPSEYDEVHSFFTAFLVPKALGKGPIPGVRLAYQKNTHALFWIFEPYNHFVGKGKSGIELTQFAAQTLVVDEERGKEVYARLDETGFSFLLPYNEAGQDINRVHDFDLAFPDLENNNEVVIKDRKSRNVYVFSVEKYGTSMRVRAVYTRQRPSVSDEIFYLSTSPETKLLLSARNSSGGTFYLFYETNYVNLKKSKEERPNKEVHPKDLPAPIPSANQDPDDLPWVDTYQESRKAHLEARNPYSAFWLYGREKLKKHLEATKTNSRPVNVNVSDATKAWLEKLLLSQKLAKNSAISLASNPKERILGLEVSRALYEQNPRIKQQLVSQVLETYEAMDNGKRPTEFLYVKAGSTSAILAEIRAQIAAHLRTAYPFGSTPPALVFIFDALGSSARGRTFDQDESKAVFDTFFSYMGNNHQESQLPGGIDVFPVFLAHAEKDTRFRTWFQTTSDGKPKLSALFESCVDCMLPEQDFLEVVAKELQRNGATTSLETLAALTSAIRAENAEWGKNFISPNDFVEDILLILNNANLDPTSSGFGLEVAQIYNQLNGVRTLSFDRNAIDRINKLYDMISANGATPLAEPLLELDDQIRQVQSILKEKQSEKRLPYLPLLLFGPGGTGKTLLAQNLAAALGARTETFNVGTLQNPKSGGPLDLRPLEAKIKLLLMHPGQKILVLEEIDKNPAIYPHLLAALDPQQKGEKTLNLEGLIVVCTANLRKEGPNFKSLTALRSSDLKNEETVKTYNDWKFETAVTGLSGGNESEEKQLIEPLVGRFFKGVVFIPSLKEMRPAEKANIVDYIAGRFQKETNIRILMRDPARARLIQALDENLKGNFRTALSAVKDELLAAETRYKEDHPGLKDFSGYFVLNLEKNIEGRVILKLEALEAGNSAVILNLVGDYLNVYNNALIAAADQATGVLRDELKRENNIGINQQYLKLRRFAEALRIVSKAEILSKADVIHPNSVHRWLKDMPVVNSNGGYTAKAQREKISDVLSKTFEPLFASIAPQEVGPPMSGPRPRDGVNRIIRVIQLLDALRAKQGTEGEHFRKWAANVVENFNKAKGEIIALSAKDLEQDITATSVLAALAINDMGRSYAQERLEKMLPKESPLTVATTKTIKTEEEAPARPKLPPRSEECATIVNAYLEELNQIKKIF